MTNPVQDAYDRLTDTQRTLEYHVTSTARGRDLYDVLVEADATPQDKAAVAEFLGGPGAGAEFLNETGR